jgi:hypothetical protein
LRGNLRGWGYGNLSLLRYLEEALAQGYATRSLWKGLIFPIRANYVMFFPDVVIEGAAYIGGIYFARRWLSTLRRDTCEAE